MWKPIVLWLFVINLGIAFGAGVYEARVVVPHWGDVPPSQWQNTGLLFWVYVTTVPLTILTILNILAAWATRGARRRWHLAAAGIVLAERVATFSYFIPTMIRLMSLETVQAEVAAALSQWLFLNHGRHLLMFAGWLCALRALSIPK